MWLDIRSSTWNRTVCWLPFIVLFGLYVLFHGDFGPGGGFQAGAIIAAGIILFALLEGENRALKAKVEGLCSELSRLLAQQTDLVRPASTQSQRQASRQARTREPRVRR